MKGLKYCDEINTVLLMRYYWLSRESVTQICMTESIDSCSNSLLLIWQGQPLGGKYVSQETSYNASKPSRRKYSIEALNNKSDWTDYTILFNTLITSVALI